MVTIFKSSIVSGLFGSDHQYDNPETNRQGIFLIHNNFNIEQYLEAPAPEYANHGLLQSGVGMVHF
jgi:hypothetical protein